MRLLPLAFLLLALGTAPALAQGQIDRNHVPSNERVDIRERRQTDVDGNQVRTTIFNFGQTGRTGAVPDEIPYEWPKNTRRHYIALTGLFVGAEVTSVTGETAYIVDVPNYRTNTADENEAWTFAPIKGYVNPAGEEFGIARSDRPASWPPFWPDKLDAPVDPGWPGSWSGYFGRDVFNADQEVYYKMGDDEYDKNRNLERTTYYPDSTDRSRAGLGLLVDTRILQWSQVLIDDAVFILHAVKNDGTQDLQKVGVTLWLADLVGGDQDTSDDSPFFDLLLDTAFLADSDGRSNDPAFPSGQSVGAAIAFFLETPGNAVDRIDNDGDGTTGPNVSDINNLGLTTGEPGSPLITLDMLAGEGDQTGPNLRFRFDGIDNNGNGLIDEDSTYAAFGTQVGVGFADRIDNDGDGEAGSPVVTQDMVNEAAGDRWGRWPSLPTPYDGSPVHLIQVGPEDLGLRFKDGIDNDDDCLLGENLPPADYLWEPGSPTITQEMVDAAAGDAPYYRYPVPGTGIILYDVRQDDLGKCYADGIDNDGDGAIDEGIDEHIDEMIDESRDDGIDNDGDWRPLLDDVGLDGAEDTGDPGENDGLPTSGAGTDLPGESNIDATDISESDQIGITNVQYKAAGAINYQTISDGSLFQQFMIPGQFVNLTNPPGTDNDLFVSSGTFPLRAGQTERVSFAVILGDVNYSSTVTAVRYQDLLNKRQSAQEAYEADYRFAQAPICPTITAVPGNGKVTLYWDSKAEDSFDTFVADLPFGLDPRDFEGYRVYRATDPAFLDAQIVTDGFGNVQFLRPIAQFDLINQYEGFHPVDINGVKYYLGNNIRDGGEADNGLAHTFTDSTAVNGIEYYYAVVSYDHGAYIPGEVAITPSECAIRLRRLADGTVETGPNVVRVTPSREAAGYVEATLGEIERVRGFATGSIGYEIVDPVAIQNGHRYRITFADTLLSGGNTSQDTLTTAGFTLVDLTDQDTLLTNSETYRPGRETPVTEGFRLQFAPVTFPAVIDNLTRWEDPAVFRLNVQRFFDRNVQGVRFPADYRIEIGEVGLGRSTEFTVREGGIPRTLPVRDTNVRIFRKTIGPNGQEVEAPVNYAFNELIPTPDPTGTTPVTFGYDPCFFIDPQGNCTGGESDRLILIEQLPNGTVKPTWQIQLTSLASESGLRNPQAGDMAQIVTRKPFLATDIYEFTARGPELDVEIAAGALDDIRVVPNPYRGTNLMEPLNPFSTGRGPRVLKFAGIPPRCTIRIFTVSGRLVKTIEHNVGSNEGVTAEMLRQGEEKWNLLTDEQLSISYGVYVYHIDAPGIGEKAGTFAVIK